MPRYRIAEGVVSGKKILRVQVKDDEVNRVLIIDLEKYPAQELGDQARHSIVRELPHQTQVSLRYGGQNELLFQEAYFQGDVLRNVLRVESASKLVELVNVVTDVEFHAELVIQRLVMVAMPYDTSAEVADLKSRLAEQTGRITQIVTQLGLFNTYQAQGDPGLASHYFQEYLRLIQLYGPEGKIGQEIADIQQRLTFLSSTPLFVETQVSLEQAITPNPFVFDKDVYKYIFRDVGDATGQGDGLIQYQVMWNGVSYSYYQEEVRPTVFRYLPHAFKLASLPDAPDIPHLSVQFVWQENAVQPTGVQLTYRAVPFMDPARRAEEAAQLRQQTHQEPSFEPLTSPSKLRTAIPTGWSSDSQPHIKEPIDLRQSFEDTVTLTWEGFREVYNSLFDRTSLLKGEVIVQVNPQQQELIPFVARVDDFIGSSSSTPDRSALLRQLLESQVAPKIERPIQVTTFPPMFNSAPDRPDDPVIAILVDFFERGNQISLTPDKLSAKVKLRLSVSDYVLSKADEGDYRYQVTLIYSSGRRVKCLEQTGSDDDLYITLET